MFFFPAQRPKCQAPCHLLCHRLRRMERSDAIAGLWMFLKGERGGPFSPTKKPCFFFVFWLKGVCLVSFFKKDGKIMSIFGEYVLKHCFFSHVLFKDHLEQL